MHVVEMALRASPSVLFDAVVVLSGPGGRQEASCHSERRSVPDGCGLGHCKAIGWAGVPELSGEAELKESKGMVPFAVRGAAKDFIKAARIGRFWDREEDKP